MVAGFGVVKKFNTSRNIVEVNFAAAFSSLGSFGDGALIRQPKGYSHRVVYNMYPQGYKCGTGKP